MQKDASFFDHSYYEGNPGQHKSNYTRVGGYKAFASGIDWMAQARSIVGDRDPAPLSILDVGCGYGFLVKALRELGANAYGMDISVHAMENCVTPYVFLGDISVWIPTPYIGSKWDIVHSADVLEHCSSEEEAERILNRLTYFAKFQVHRVNSGEHPNQAFEGDASHGLRMPLIEWQKLAASIDVSIKITI